MERQADLVPLGVSSCKQRRLPLTRSSSDSLPNSSAQSAMVPVGASAAEMAAALEQQLPSLTGVQVTRDDAPPTGLVAWDVTFDPVRYPAELPLLQANTGSLTVRTSRALRHYVVVAKIIVTHAHTRTTRAYSSGA